MDDYKFLFKVVLVGNAGVGKTCLVRRFTQGLFPPGQGATIGVDFMIKTVEVEGEKVKVCLSVQHSSVISFITKMLFLVANLGYSWAGTFSIYNTKLLQISTCFNTCLRYFLSANI